MSIQRRIYEQNKCKQYAVKCDRCGVSVPWNYNSQDAIEDAIGSGWKIASNDFEGDLCEDCLQKMYPQEVQHD